jgi:phenylalanyl-tRNA synthetase beta subunit
MAGARACDVVEREGGEATQVGTRGVLHPKVLDNFELAFSVCELGSNLEAIVV